MRTYLDCIPCFFKQALESARLAGAPARRQKEILDRLARILPTIPLEASPPEMGRHIYGLVNKMTGKKDPYRQIKKKSNKLALRLYDRLKAKVRLSRDRLLTAVELAIAGNIIDYGVKNSLNVDSELRKILSEEDRAIRKESRRLFNYRMFKRAVRTAKIILYLGDNAGEIVFDKILIEEIIRANPTKKIVYVVRGRPIINDALIEDAHACGMHTIVDVISSGLDIPGTVLSQCSPAFLKLYRKADIIISKGQGNFEALSGTKKPVFYLFMAKCPVVAKHIFCNVGDVILLYNKASGKRRLRR